MKNQKLQRRLLIYFALVAFLPVLTILVFYLYFTQENTEQQLIENYQQRAEYALDKIENKVTQVNEFATWIFQNAQIQELLLRTSDQSDYYDEVTHVAAQGLLKQFSYRPITRDILSLFLLGNNGLDLRGGTDASLISRQSIEQLLHYDAGSEAYWGYLTDNLTKLTETPKVVFYRHPIMDENTGSQVGWLIMLFSDQMFSEECADLLVSENDCVALYNSNGGVLAAYGADEASQEITCDSQSLSLGWKLVGSMDDGVISGQLRGVIYSGIITATVIFMLMLLLAWYLSHYFTRPIERIMRQVSRISKGDFSHPQVCTAASDEIGQLEEQITQMGDSIDKLLHEQITREREKRRLEVRMLQNQLNPHFLYNTLNSIKLMAAMQGKTSIQNMIEALGRLLRANLSLQDEWITLSQEFMLLDGYILIQNTAQKGKIQYRCVGLNDAVSACMVPKLLLQPIVENSIVHGLAPLPMGGKITISVRKSRGTLYFRIKDNGIGMKNEELAALRTKLASRVSLHGQDKHGIGLWNTVRRLELQYGTEAALSVRSQMGKGTSVMICLPVKEKGIQNEL